LAEHCITGYVVGRAAGACKKGFMTLLNMNTLRLHNVLPSDPQELASGCQKKKFIIKAQLPISKKLLSVSSTDVACFLHIELI